MAAVNPLEQENNMASSQDTNSRRNGNDESQMANNHSLAMAQGEKSSFRAHKVAMNADPFNPTRIDNAIQQKLLDN